MYSSPYAAHEDLSVNEQESIVEFVLENLLGIENAVPESAEEDSFQDLGKVLICCHEEQKHLQIPENRNPATGQVQYISYHSFLLEVSPELNPPPPRR